MNNEQILDRIERQLCVANKIALMRLRLEHYAEMPEEMDSLANDIRDIEMSRA